jgi:hypothetical protein
MGIIAGDASKMAQRGARRRPAIAAPGAADANKVETIQSVLRHLLGEMTACRLGKS